MKFWSLALVFIFLSSPALAFEKLFTEQCKAQGVPRELAMAIARQESALNPLCINVAGDDYWPKTRSEAETIIRKAQKKDLSYDVGLMQINSQWIKQWKIDPVSLLDPATNIRYGLKILKDEIRKYGMNWRAIGGYHSPNPLRARRYALMVYSRVKGRPEIRAMLSNPRMRSHLMSRKLKNFKPSYSADNSLLINTQRKPVGIN